jgi:hypothetical protein
VIFAIEQNGTVTYYKGGIMKRIFWIPLVIMLITVPVVFIACSLDDVTDPIVKEPGDPDDPVFAGARMAVEFTEWIDVQMVRTMFVMIDSVINHPDYPYAFKYNFPDFDRGITADSFSFVYHENSRYWYVYFHIVDTLYIDTTMIVRTLHTEDSVKFLHGIVGVQWPNPSLLTGIRRGLLSLVQSFEFIEQFEVHQDLTVDGNIFEAVDVTLNGNATYNTYFLDSEYEGPFCYIGIDLSSTYTDILVSPLDLYTDLCPMTGSIKYRGLIDLNCFYADSNIVNEDYWYINRTMDGTDFDYIIENSTHRWEYDKICSSDSVSTPGDRHGMVLK